MKCRATGTREFLAKLTGNSAFPGTGNRGKLTLRAVDIVEQCEATERAWRDREQHLLWIARRVR